MSDRKGNREHSEARSRGTVVETVWPMDAQPSIHLIPRCPTLKRNCTVPQQRKRDDCDRFWPAPSAIDNMRSSVADQLVSALRSWAFTAIVRHCADPSPCTPEQDASFAPRGPSPRSLRGYCRPLLAVCSTLPHSCAIAPHIPLTTTVPLPCHLTQRLCVTMRTAQRWSVAAAAVLLLLGVALAATSVRADSSQTHSHSAAHCAALRERIRSEIGASRADPRFRCVHVLSASRISGLLHRSFRPFRARPRWHGDPRGRSYHSRLLRISLWRQTRLQILRVAIWS